MSEDTDYFSLRRRNAPRSTSPSSRSPLPLQTAENDRPRSRLPSPAPSPSTFPYRPFSHSGWLSPNSSTFQGSPARQSLGHTDSLETATRRRSSNFSEKDLLPLPPVSRSPSFTSQRSSVAPLSTGIFHELPSRSNSGQIGRQPSRARSPFGVSRGRTLQPSAQSPQLSGILRRRTRAAPSILTTSSKKYSERNDVVGFQERTGERVKRFDRGAVSSSPGTCEAIVMKEQADGTLKRSVCDAKTRLKIHEHPIRVFCDGERSDAVERVDRDEILRGSDRYYCYKCAEHEGIKPLTYVTFSEVDLIFWPFRDTDGNVRGEGDIIRSAQWHFRPRTLSEEQLADACERKLIRGGSRSRRYVFSLLEEADDCQPMNMTTLPKAWDKQDKWLYGDLKAARVQLFNYDTALRVRQAATSRSDSRGRPIDRGRSSDPNQRTNAHAISRQSATSTSHSRSRSTSRRGRRKSIRTGSQRRDKSPMFDLNEGSLRSQWFDTESAQESGDRRTAERWQRLLTRRNEVTTGGGLMTRGNVLLRPLSYDTSADRS